MAHQGSGVALTARKHVGRGYTRTGLAAAPAGPPLAGYLFWLDASAITGAADNTALATWRDRSAAANNFTAAGAAQPTYYSSTAGKTVNGKPAVWFSGAQWMTAGSAVAQAQPFTFYAVARLAGTLGASTYALVSTASPLCTYSQVFGQTYWQIFAGTTGTATTIVDNNQLHIYTAVFNGAASLVKMDATASAALNAGANAMGGVPILGSQAATGSNQWNGPICEVLAYPSAVSGANDTAVRAYLKNKWGTP